MTGLVRRGGASPGMHLWWVRERLQPYTPVLSLRVGIRYGGTRGRVFCKKIG